VAKNIHINYNILSINQVVCFIAENKITISRITKYGPFQFTVVCSHVQSAGPPFLGAEEKTVKYQYLKQNVTANS